jgi:hypothetical protein
MFFLSFFAEVVSTRFFICTHPPDGVFLSSLINHKSYHRISLLSVPVCMAEWLDGHLGSSRSRVETLLE